MSKETGTAYAGKALAAQEMREPVKNEGYPDSGLPTECELELESISLELALLAAGLELEPADLELKLRERYLTGERRLLLTCSERDRILAQYNVIYGPLRRWSEFLRIIGVARQTAYDLLDAVAEAEAPESETASRRSTSAPPARYGNG